MGFLITNLFVLSGVVFVAAILAYLMKLPWNPNIYPHIAELGFQTIFRFPFFQPSSHFGSGIGCQIMAGVARFRAKTPAPIAQQSYLILLCTIVLGLITFFSLGDVSIGDVAEQFDLSPQVEKQVNVAVSWAGTLFSGIFFSALIPYLMPKKLLESGTSRSGPWKTAIFNVIGTTLVIGGPLFIFYFLAHEDISNRIATRIKQEGDFHTSHVALGSLVPKLESQVMSRSATRSILGRDLLEAINNNKRGKADRSSVLAKAPQSRYGN